MKLLVVYEDFKSEDNLPTFQGLNFFPSIKKFANILKFMLRLKNLPHVKLMKRNKSCKIVSFNLVIYYYWLITNDKFSTLLFCCLFSHRRSLNWEISLTNKGRFLPTVIFELQKFTVFREFENVSKLFNAWEKVQILKGRKVILWFEVFINHHQFHELCNIIVLRYVTLG